MLSQIEADHHQALKKLKNELDLQIPGFVKNAIMQLSLDDIEEEEKIDILRILNGPKFENRQQFLLLIPEYLIKYLLRIRRAALLNHSDINQQNPKNLGEFLYISLLPYEDYSLSKYPILQNVVKNVNFSIMNFLHERDNIVQALKHKDIQIIIKKYEIQTKKQICKSKLQQGCSNCLCKIRKQEQSQLPTVKCRQCKEYYHAACLKKDETLKRILCPYCAMCNTNPLEKVIQVLHQPVLLDMSETKKEKSLNFECPLSNCQVQLRCLELGEVEQFKWPEAGEIFLNNQKIINIDKKVSKQSYSITSSIKQGCFNRLTIFYQQSFSKQLQFLNLSAREEQLKTQYLFCVFEVKVYTTRELLLELFQNKENQISVIESQNRIIKYQKKMIIKQMKISLLDVTNKKFMRVPGRGKMCRHIQCFDLEVFLNNGVTQNQWDCPLCQQKCYQLFIDKYMEQLVERFKGTEINEIEFDSEAQLIGDYDQQYEEMQIEL